MRRKNNVFTEHSVIVDGKYTKGRNTLETAKKWVSASQAEDVYFSNGELIKTLYTHKAVVSWMIITSQGERLDVMYCEYLRTFFEYCNRVGLTVVTVYHCRESLSTVGTEFYLDRP